MFNSVSCLWYAHLTFNSALVCVRESAANTWRLPFPFHSSSFGCTFRWHWTYFLMIILAPDIFSPSLKWIYFRRSLKSSLPEFSEAAVIMGHTSSLHFPVYQLILAKMTYCRFCRSSNGTALSRLCFYEIMPEKTLFKVCRGPPDVRLRKRLCK